MQEKSLQNLVINKVENQEVYDSLSANGAINSDELYLVGGGSSVDSVNGQTGDVNLDIPVVHKIESQDAYDEMVTAGQINAGELYLVQGDEYVQYTEQSLTDEQKAQARENIGAASDAAIVVYDVFSGEGGCAGTTGKALAIFLAPPEEENQNDTYTRWGLTKDDFPLTSRCTSFSSQGTFPTFYFTLVTATGRVFSIGGGANMISSWTPVEIFPSSLTLKSSTENSTKNFKITVDDSGTISATEVN